MTTATTASAAAVLRLPLTVVRLPASAAAATRNALQQYELLGFSPPQPLLEPAQPLALRLALPMPSREGWEALGLIALILVSRHNRRS